MYFKLIILLSCYPLKSFVVRTLKFRVFHFIIGKQTRVGGVCETWTMGIYLVELVSVSQQKKTLTLIPSGKQALWTHSWKMTRLKAVMFSSSWKHHFHFYFFHTVTHVVSVPYKTLGVYDLKLYLHRKINRKKN